VEGLNGADKLWDLANLVTGFAVAQSLAIIFSMARNDFKMPNKKRHWLAFIGITLFTICYIVAIELCGNEGQLLDKTHANLWQQVTRGRVFAVILFALVTVGVIYLHWRDELRRRDPSCCMK
jgi:uncharacterized membrane protein (DUF485 family)